MKKTTTFLAAAASLSLVATPIAAQADRATQPAEEGEEIFGGNIIVTALVVAAIIAGIIIIADDDDDVPVSP